MLVLINNCLLYLRMSSNGIFLYVHVVVALSDDSVPLKPAEIVTTTGTILQQANEKAIGIVAVKLVTDHLHLLLQLQSFQNLQSVMQFILQQSQSFVTAIRTGGELFSWADDYLAFSVSPNMLGKTKDYFANQAQWHQGRSLQDEIDMMMAMAAAQAVSG